MTINLHVVFVHSMLLSLASLSLEIFFNLQIMNAHKPRINVYLKFYVTA